MADQYLSAEILMDMSKSIANVYAYSEAIEGLDSKIGSLEGRLNALGDSLGKVSDRRKVNLRASIEKQISDAIEASGVALEGVGDGALKVDTKTIKKINDSIHNELNRELMSAADDIKLKIDASHIKTVSANIGEEHFKEFNGQIVKIVKAKLNEMRKSMSEVSVDLSKSEISNMSLIIGKDLVQKTIQAVKSAIQPILANPTVNVEGVKLVIPVKSSRQIVNKVMKSIMASMNNSEVDSTPLPKGLLTEMNDHISKLVMRQIQSMNSQLKALDLNSLERPVNELNRRTKMLIAEQLGSSVKELEKANMTVDNGFIRDIQFKDNFTRMEKSLNDKVGKLTSQFSKEVLTQIDSVSFQVQPSVAHDIINELNRINKSIVKKIKQQVDLQIAHIINEIEAASATPLNLNSNNVNSLNNLGNQLRPRGGRAGNSTTTIINNYGGSGGQARPNTSILSNSGDNYSRRDDYFNSMGLEGAIKNTLRHVVSGALVGAPIMAIYDAMNTFKETQLEMLKAYQNYYMQEYVGSGGSVNSGMIEAEIKELNDVTKRMAVHYGINYTSMSEVAAVASRVTENEDQSRVFMDSASKILRLDNSGDIVKDIAPGLEAIMLQFGMSVYELNRVVASFAVVSNVTKASTKELMEGLSRSGASFRAAGISMEEATVMMGGAIQTTGLTAPDLGNMFKSLNTRITMPSVVGMLKEHGIDVYNDDGSRVDGAELYQKIANLVTNPNTTNEVRDAILLDTSGLYQANKFNAFIKSMNTNDVQVSDEDGKYYKPFNLNKHFDAVNFETEEAMIAAMEMVSDLLVTSLNNPAISMDRAGVAVNVALTSLIEELTPQIKTLSDAIVTASEAVQNNSDKIAQLGAILLDAAVGFTAYQGIAWSLNKGGYQEHRENYRTQDRVYGSRNGSTPPISAPILALLGNDLRGISSRNSDSFRIFDMMNGSPQIANVMNTLAEMDDDTARRIVQYNEDYRGGKEVRSFGELATLLQEGQGYFVPDMDDNERDRRSRGNIEGMIQRDTSSAMFGNAFANVLQNYDIMTATPETRRMFDTMSRMSDANIQQFESFIAREAVTNGTRINNVEDLRETHTRFQRFQADNVDEYHRNDLDTHRINRRYDEMMNEVNNGAPTTGFAGLVTRGTNAAGSFIRSLGELGKTAGRLAGQFGLLMAAGSVLTEWIENSTLTDNQKDVRNAEKDIDFLKSIHEFKSNVLGGDDSLFDKIFSGASTVGTWLYDGLLDLIPGIDRNGIGDVLGGDLSAETYNETLKKLYGTTDIDKIIGDSADGETGKPTLTADKIIAEVLKELGLTDKLKDAETADYLESYHKFMEDQATQYENQRKAEAARETYSQNLLENSPNKLSLPEFYEMIEKELESVTKSNKIEEIGALLGGVKTNSDEYYRLMMGHLDEQLKIYEKSLDFFDTHIKSLRQKMAELEEEGLGVGDNKAKHKIAESDLNDTISKRQELEEKYELERAEIELEKRKLDYARRRQQATNFKNEKDDETFYDSIDTAMTTGDGTIERGQALREDLQNQLNREKDILAMYEELAQYDIDGETEDLIREQKRKITEFNKAYFETYQQDLSSYGSNVSKVESKNSIELLKAQVATGITDANDPALKGIRNTLLNKELAAVNTEMARAQATLADLVSAGADPTTISDYEDTILALERQSLEVQLEQLSEMKSSKGTFNLPDGLKVMSELDYKMGQSSHSQYTFQQGETYVTVVLPNVTGTSSRNTLNNLGRSIGTGISSGRISSYRTQIASNPSGYRTL